jgi:hypothetical protein
VDDPYRNKRVRRWRKCVSVADDFVDRLYYPQTGLSVEEKKEVLRRFWKDNHVHHLLPQSMQDIKSTESKLQLVGSVQQAYIHMVANKSTKNASYRNALLSAVVSREDGPSERFLARTLQATRHTLRKAVVRRAYVKIYGVDYQERRDQTALVKENNNSS